ncbi:MAG: hypothetical protein JHC25_04985 [Thermodesulfobacterium sp.]|jgi:NDP-sugar pyrophosphorylase family protein|nr:hypothetical protein [Thermodesulfobacterium sp.]
MEPQTTAEITPEYIKQLIYSILPEVLAQYREDRERAFYNQLLDRLIRLEEELKALRIEMNIRFDAIIREMNARFEALKQESDAKFEAVNARFEVLTKEMNARFEAQKQESDAKFEAINARFEALDKRLSFLQWLIVFGFTFISVVITLLNFLK